MFGVLAFAFVALLIHIAHAAHYYFSTSIIRTTNFGLHFSPQELLLALELALVFETLGVECSCFYGCAHRATWFIIMLAIAKSALRREFVYIREGL
jgi:hypothetical protein